MPRMNISGLKFFAAKSANEGQGQSASFDTKQNKPKQAFRTTGEFMY